MCGGVRRLPGCSLCPGIGGAVRVAIQHWQQQRLTSFVTSATRWANLQVDIDSSICPASPLMVATMTVLQLPPRLSRSTSVIKLLRYGTCTLHRNSRHT